MLCGRGQQPFTSTGVARQCLWVHRPALQRAADGHGDGQGRRGPLGLGRGLLPKLGARAYGTAPSAQFTSPGANPYLGWLIKCAESQRWGSTSDLGGTSESGFTKMPQMSQCFQGGIVGGKLLRRNPCGC